MVIWLSSLSYIHDFVVILENFNTNLREGINTKFVSVLFYFQSAVPVFYFRMEARL